MPYQQPRNSQVGCGALWRVRGSPVAVAARFVGALHWTSSARLLLLQDIRTRWRDGTAMYGRVCVEMICSHPETSAPELIAMMVWDLLSTCTLVRLL